MQVSDEILFSGIKKDDYASFNQLFARYYSRLCAYVLSQIQNSNSAEDIVQELFIRIWTHRRRIEIKENISGYLYRAAKNSALNYLRSEKNRTKLLQYFPEGQIQNDEMLLEQIEFSHFLQQCIDELPERSKEVFMKSRIDGLKHQEIAEQSGTSVKTIKNQLWKSLQYLKSCLERKDAF